VRILFLCHRIPYPPDKGEKIRAFHQLRAMSSRHEVDVFTLAADPGELAHHDALAEHCRTLTVARIIPKLARMRSIPYLLTRSPLTIPYFYSASLQARVLKAIATRTYDRVFVYCSAMAQYLPQTFSAAPIIVDLVDVDSDKWAQYGKATNFPFSMIYRREARCLRAYERAVCEQAAGVVVTTEREAQLARLIAPASRVHVVPNGVDGKHFHLVDRNEAAGLATIVFTGDMSYFPNQQAVVFFARRVLPLTRREVPHARFVIVGRDPDREVQELGRLDGVEVTGSVPDVRPWLAQASVAVAPMTIAAGLQNKILEALSSGLPVVATTRAVQGLSAAVGASVHTGDSPEELAASVARLLLNPQLARQRGLEGRRRVAADYDWDRSLARLLRLIDQPDEEPAAALPIADDRAGWVASA